MNSLNATKLAKVMLLSPFIITQRPPAPDKKQASESVWVSLMKAARGPEDSREAPRAGGRRKKKHLLERLSESSDRITT